MDKTLFKEIFAGLIGKPPSPLTLGHGSFLTHDIGPLSKEGRGEWCLWLRICHWRIESLQEMAVGSDDQRKDIESTLKALNPVVIRSIEVLYPSLDLIIVYTSGWVIRTFSAASNQEDQWTVYTSEGMALTAHGGGLYDFEPCDLDDD